MINQGDSAHLVVVLALDEHSGCSEQEINQSKESTRYSWLPSLLRITLLVYRPDPAMGDEGHARLRQFANQASVAVLIVRDEGPLPVHCIELVKVVSEVRRTIIVVSKATVSDEVRLELEDLREGHGEIEYVAYEKMGFGEAMRRVFTSRSVLLEKDLASKRAGVIEPSQNSEVEHWPES